MYLLAKFSVHRSCGNGDMNFYINLYTLEKAELTASIHHNQRFSKSGIPVYNSKVLDMAGRKAMRRTQTIPKRYVCDLIRGKNFWSFIIFLSNKQWFIFLYKTALWRRIQSATIHKTQRMSSIFKRMLFAETKETSRTSSFVVFCIWCKRLAFFDRLISFSFELCKRQGVSLFGVHDFYGWNIWHCTF